MNVLTWLLVSNIIFRHSNKLHVYICFTGKQPQLLAPLQDLRVEDLRKELRARGHNELDQHKPELQKDLKQLLKRVNRVPSLLLLNPQQGLHNLHLTNYSVMNCEPRERASIKLARRATAAAT